MYRSNKHPSLALCKAHVFEERCFNELILPLQILSSPLPTHYHSRENEWMGPAPHTAVFGAGGRGGGEVGLQELICKRRSSLTVMIFITDRQQWAVPRSLLHSLSALLNSPLVWWQQVYPTPWVAKNLCGRGGRDPLGFPTASRSLSNAGGMVIIYSTIAISQVFWRRGDLLPSLCRLFTNKTNDDKCLNRPGILGHKAQHFHWFCCFSINIGKNENEKDSKSFTKIMKLI